MDPLRPFADLIRSLRVTRLKKTERATGSTSDSSHRTTSAPLDGPGAVSPLRGKLRTRLGAMKTWDPQRARQLFVECALTSELGEDLAKDPAFADLARRVEMHLSHEPRISARLDDLLREIARSNGPR